MQKNRGSEEKGITLVALVVTIVVILIIAGITIGITVRNGVISEAELAREKQIFATVDENLRLALNEVAQEEPIGEIKVDNYLNKLIQKEMIEEDEIEDLGEGKQVIVEGQFMYLVKYDDDENVIEVEYMGKVGAIKPKLTLVNVSNTTSTITVEVTTKRNEGGKIEYYYKTEEETEYKLDESTENTTHIYEKLTENKTYNIKIVAVAQNGQTDEVYVDVLTSNVIEIQQGDIDFKADPEGWEDEKITVTATPKIDITGFTLETSKDAQNWDDVASQEFNVNGAMYVRVVDENEQYKGIATYNVEKIDNLAPNEFTPEPTSTINSVTVVANATDKDATEESGKSGIQGYSFRINGGTWTDYQESGTYTFNELDPSTLYSIEVMAKDNAGNTTPGTTSITTKRSAVEITNADIDFRAEPDGWEDEKIIVTATANIDITGLTLETSKDAKNWDDVASQEFTENGSMHVRVIDSSGAYKGTATYNVEKIDNLDPNEFTPQLSSTINSVTVTASTTDRTATEKSGQSGIAGYSFRINGGTWTDYQESGTHTFTGLSQNQSCSIEVMAKDNAGNTTKGSNSITTKTVSIGLASSSGYTKVNGIKTVTVNASNHGSVSLSTSNSNIATATVSGSTITITGKAAGTATITATATSDTSKTATYTIYVTSLTAPSTTSHTLEIGKTVTLTAPTKSTYAGTVTYTSNNTGVATVNSSTGLVTAVAGGTATITAREANGGATVSYTITVNKNKLLASVVSQGDYVNYPVTYTNTSAFCGHSSTDTGWRVMYVSSGCVYLVSASAPTAYATNLMSATTISGVNTWLNTQSNWTSYRNTTYANYARGLIKSDLDTANGSSLTVGSTYTNTVIKSGIHYYLGNPGSSTVIYGIEPNGLMREKKSLEAKLDLTENSNFAAVGFRVVVQLKSTIRTTGKSSNVWQLTTSTGN